MEPATATFVERSWVVAPVDVSAVLLTGAASDMEPSVATRLAKPDMLADVALTIADEVPGRLKASAIA
jgi:hypothetical protein